ncbi:MAG: LruC domain-containing protein [Planctomycetota bacterium]
MIHSYFTPLAGVALGLLVNPLAAQDTFNPVPQSVVDTIGYLLPEKSNAGAAFLSESYSPNLVISELANVEVTFLWEGAGYRNSLGWFTYADNPDGSVEILSSSLLIPDASFPPQGNTFSGDTFFLKNPDGTQRLFEPGEKVAFFLVADGWNMEPLIQGWDAENPQIPSSEPAENLGFGRGCFTTLNKLNPENLYGAAEEARHLAMIWMPAVSGFMGGEPYLLCGFEDILRTANSDNDFNDLVFVVSASPIEALDETEAFSFEPGDPDGDGIEGVDDHYPSDTSRSFRLRIPSSGFRVAGFEDRYPWIGDADYNDAVVAWYVEQVTDSQGRVKDLCMTAHLVARGATYDHRLGLRLGGLPSWATGNYQVERFTSGDPGDYQLEQQGSLQSLIQSQDKRVTLFESTTVALPPPIGNLLTNTYTGSIDRPAASVRVRYSFEQPIAAAYLGAAPYDLFLSIVHDDELWDVHFPGKPGFSERPGYLPDESGPDSFLDDQGNPWAVEIPMDWRFPLEQVAIWNGYPQFLTWASSEGAEAANWYQYPTSLGGLLSEPLFEYVPERDWSLSLPVP